VFYYSYYYDIGKKLEKVGKVEKVEKVLKLRKFVEKNKP
jgi:hypothetical protein